MMEAVELRLYRQPVVPVKWMFQAFKRALKLAGPFHGDAFVPLLARDEEYERADPELLARGFTISADQIARTNKWPSFGPTVLFYEFGFTLLLLQTVLWKAPKSLDLSWELSLHLAKAFIRSTGADLAVIGGADSLSSLPFRNDVPRAKHLPKFFGPWTFLGGQRLNAQRRKELAALPAFAFEEFAGGVIVQATPDLRTEPEVGFTAALGKVSNPTVVKYHQAAPPRGGKR